MANCLDQILCNQASDCDVYISDENGFEIDSRYLNPYPGDFIREHFNDDYRVPVDKTMYIHVGERVGYTFRGFMFYPIEGEPYTVPYEYVGNDLYKLVAICGGTFVANFTTNIYELTVIPDNDIHGSTLGSGRYPYNTVVHISAMENPGYHFIGWYINDVLISNDIEYAYTVTEDTFIVAHFEGDEYSIVAKPNNRLLGSASGSGVYEYGTVVTLTATPFVGSTFISWDDGDTSLTKTITVTQNKIYIANFQRNRYTVTVIIVNASATRPTEVCGVVTGEGVYEYGTVVTLYASPSLGFSFVSWDNGPEHVDDNNRYSFTIQGDTTIYATFDDAMYTLTLYSSPTNGGYTTNSVSTALFTGGTYRYNTVVPAQALPYSGYLFDKWSDGTLTDVRSFTMTSDITQTAYFIADIPRYTLKVLFDSMKGNVVIMDGLNDVTSYGAGFVYATVDEGTVLTVIVTEIAPYIFSGWDDSTTEGLTRVFTVNSDITREVYFNELAEYRICVCTGFQWFFGHFIAHYNDETRIINSNERCITVTSGTEVTIEYVQDNTYYIIDDWGTSGLGEMDYTINNQEITIIVTDNGEVCPSVIQNKGNIGVQNNPSNVLANQIDFTINYTGGTTEIKTPNNDTKYVGPITTYPTPVYYSATVTTPIISGYHFVNITGNNGDESFGTDTISGIIPNSGIVLTCNYEQDDCQTVFNFDYQNAATLTIGGQSYRSNTSSITVTSGQTFTVIADPNYYITDIVDVNTGNSVGACQYCYSIFPIPDSSGYVYYYRSIQFSNIPIGATITTIYTPSFIINANSPQYVKYVKSGEPDRYAELISLDLSIPPVFDDIWHDLSGDNIYDFVDYPDEDIPSLINSATASSPDFIRTKGSDSFFVKTKADCTYNVECGHTYQICMLNGNYVKPLHVWDPIVSIPSGTPPSEIIVDSTTYMNYTYFYYAHNPDSEYSAGKRYAQINILGSLYYLHLVNNC